MSQDNVDIVRRSFAAFNAGDLEAAASEFHPELEWIPYLGRLDAGVYQGPAEIVRMWSDLKSHLSRFRIEPVELIDCGRQVIAVIEVRGSGNLSGATIAQRWAQLYWIEEGLVRKMEVFPTREEALKAANAGSD